MNELQVLKTTGKTEAYQSSKVSNSVKLAGATPEEAESITAQVGQWAMQNAKDNQISSQEIRSKIIKLLEEKNKDAALNYKSYVNRPVQ